MKISNKKKYGKLLLTTIREQHSFKIYVYPQTLVDAYEMLSSHTSHGNVTTNKIKKEIKTTTTSTKLKKQGVRPVISQQEKRDHHMYRLKLYLGMTADSFHTSYVIIVVGRVITQITAQARRAQPSTMESNMYRPKDRPRWITTTQLRNDHVKRCNTCNYWMEKILMTMRKLFTFPGPK